MPLLNDGQALYLADILRHIPIVGPQDSVQRFLDVLSCTPFTMLPVVDETRLLGYAHQADIQFMLGIASGDARATALRQPVDQFMRGATLFLTADATLRAAEVQFAAGNTEMIAVIDEVGNYCGIVAARDLLCGVRMPLRLPTIGGMATPFGVYLSDGVNQGGVGNWALVSSGAVLGLLAVTSSFCVHAMFTAVGTAAHIDLSYLTEDYIAPSGDVKLGLLALSVHLCSTLVFLLMVRTTRIAGFHAAEHQTVHAIEHGEELLPELVARMPRPHPRCGTNLMGAGILFWNLSSLLRTLPGFDGDSATLVAILVTMVYWRRFGTMLQSVFTTKQASKTEIESGIYAAQQVINKYRSHGPRHRTALRRIWCSGMVQSLVGLAPTLIVLSMLLEHWMR